MIWSKIWKGILFVAGIAGVVAQAKARGASHVEAAAEGLTAVGAAAGTLQMVPLGKKTPTP